MPMWIGAPELICEGPDAQARLTKINDSKYHIPELGTLKVDEERWQEAQKFEKHGWTVCWNYAESDRNHEHATIFDNYKVVPSHLGTVLEIGCGPFTQTRTILEGRTADVITLLDPLINSYLTMPHCPYRNGKLCDISTTFLAQSAESIEIVAKFNTIICINVLEHVMDAILIFNNIYKALKPGGVLIMGERAWDDFDPLQLYDVGHPVRVRTAVFDSYRRRFKILYQNGNYFIGQK